MSTCTIGKYKVTSSIVIINFAAGGAKQNISDDSILAHGKFTKEFLNIKSSRGSLIRTKKLVPSLIQIFPVSIGLLVNSIFFEIFKKS